MPESPFYPVKNGNGNLAFVCILVGKELPLFLSAPQLPMDAVTGNSGEEQLEKSREAEWFPGFTDLLADLN